MNRHEGASLHSLGYGIQRQHEQTSHRGPVSVYSGPCWQAAQRLRLENVSDQLLASWIDVKRERSGAGYR